MAACSLDLDLEFRDTMYIQGSSYIYEQTNELIMAGACRHETID